MEEQRYQDALERAKQAIKECGDNVGRIRMIESIFPELAGSKKENIRKSILMMFRNALPDVFNRYGMNKNDAIAYMEDLKDIDERLEQAYKNGDGVFFKKGYDAAMAEMEKKGRQITDCPQDHQDVNRPNGCITMEDFSGGDGFYKLNIEYLSKRQVEEIEEIVRTWNNESKTSDEVIKNCIGMCLTDVCEQRFKDYNTSLKDCLAWLEKVKDFDKELDQAYKTADEVQYNKGYRDAMEEKEKFVDVILDFPTNFEREVSHFAAGILNKEYDYNAAFIKISAKGLLESAKLELEKKYTIKDGNSIDPHFGKPITITKMVNDFANGDLQPSLLEIDAYRRGISDMLEKQGEQNDYDNNVITRNDEILQAISIGLSDIKEDTGCSDFGGIPIDEIQEWVEKQGEQNPVDEAEPLPIKAGNWYVCIKDYQFCEHDWLTFEKGKIYKSFKDNEMTDEDGGRWPFNDGREFFRIATNEEIESIQKSSDKTEQKFKVGNWYQCTKDFFGKGVTFDKDTAYYCAKEGCLQNEYGCHIAIVKDLYDNFKLWTIQDAQKGDVLARNDDIRSICIFSHFDGINKREESFLCRCGLEGEGLVQELSINGYHTDSEGYAPATKEQRDTLMRALADVGYTWDDEKKELIHSQVIKESEQNGKKWIDEKVYWKEREELFEDGKQEVINNPEKYGLIKDDGHIANDSKKAGTKTWSEEDQVFFDLLEGYLELDYDLSINDKSNTFDWLKSVKLKMS